MVPNRKAQTKIDRDCVQAVDGVLQFDSDPVRVAVEDACSTNRQRCKVRSNASIAHFDGISNTQAMNAVTQSHRIAFVHLDAKAKCNLHIVQTLSQRQLRKRHHAKLLSAGHAVSLGCDQSSSTARTP